MVEEVPTDTDPKRPMFRVGQFVQFPYGGELIVACIVEDRGNIGWRGRRLYRVEFPPGYDGGDPVSIEFPAAELEPAPAGAVPTK